MEWTALFTEVLKLSPFAGSLLYFLFTVWNSMQKKDSALLETMKEHQASMLQMQKESITAQTNSADSNRLLAESNRQQADANRQLAGAIVEMKDHLSDKLEDIDRKLPRNGSPRKVAAAVDITKSAA
jgi:arginine deiminase